MPTIISTDTTWQTGQTVTLTDDVQIAAGAKLTIAPGAKIQGNGHSITTFGTLDIAGTANARAELDFVYLKFGSNTATPGRIAIDHAVLKYGAFLPPTGNESYGSFSITNSVISNAGQSYVWYPTSDSVIAGNIFVNSGGLSIGTAAGVTLHVNDNAFIDPGTAINGSAAIVVWASYGNPVDVSGNTFVGANGVMAHAALEVVYSGATCKIAGARGII